ncbi:hypothetical protein P5E86_11535 [Clostridium perfringens]|nr:hypothetical protein [Clostridium perfringens]
MAIFMKELGIKSIIVKKYRPTSKKKPKEGLENFLKRDFTINITNDLVMEALKNACYL